MKIKLYNDNCLRILPKLGYYECIFADIPDNIGLKYNSYNDNLPVCDYIQWIDTLIRNALQHTKIFWISFNTKWIVEMGHNLYYLLNSYNDFKLKTCVQTFTFGQHNQRDFCNNHRPLWRISHKDAIFYPNNIREKSWRQIHSDKRANPAGRIPGDVFNIPRVTGNSKQRKKWIPTQLNTLLLEKIISFSTMPGDTVLDLCAGSGSMLTACKKIDRNCHLIEIDRSYCEKIAQDHNLTEIRTIGLWV